MLLVLGKVVVRAIGHALQLLAAEGKVELDIISFLRVVSALSVRDVKHVEFLPGKADLLIEGEPVLQPFISQPETVFRSTKVLDLHLFKFPGTESEVAGIDFIPEGLADLRDAEGDFHP